METLDGLNVVFHVQTSAEMFGISKKLAERQDLAEEYAIVADGNSYGGIIVYAKYHGRWSANPWSTRWIIRVLLLNIGVSLPPVKPMED